MIEMAHRRCSSVRASIASPGNGRWDALPSRLAMPDSYALVSLEINGRAVPDYDRSSAGLTLGHGSSGPRQADALSMRVFRRLEDGLPARLNTRLRLDVAGHAREAVLGPVLPKGFVATRLQSALPARLQDDGRLRVQLRPGQWQVTLEARATEALTSVDITLPDSPWPRHETWSYADAPNLRQTRAQGHAVDAAQAGVPGDWQQLPAFQLDASDGLQIEPGVRAGEGGASDRVRINRQLWLGFDGDSYQARDHLTGTLVHPRRFQVGAPWQLLDASEHGQPLLIGKGDKNTRGVELRHRQVNIEAGLEAPRPALAGLPASGWQLTLDDLDVHIDLPPGYRLLGAPGADASPDSWVAQWTLLDLFLLALIALLCGRLLGWPMAVLAGGYLLLAHQQSFAPYLTVLLAAALALLMRALPVGRLRTGAHIAAAVFLVLAVLWALPFAGLQLRNALYPQLEASVPHAGVADLVSSRQAAIRRAKTGVADNEQARPARPPVVVEEKSMMALQAPPAPAAVAPEPEPLPDTSIGPVQTGPGIPDWHVGNRYHVHWNGPVTPAQGMRLIIAPAWLVRLLRVLAVLALAVLLARLLRSVLPEGGRRWRPAAGAAALLLILPALLPAAQARAADAPSQALLQQLKQRLLEPPDCAPACAMIAQARIEAGDTDVQVMLQLQSEAAVAVPMPGASDGLILVAARVDGLAAEIVSEGGRTLLRVERGVHAVQLDYRVRGDNLGLTFAALKPKTFHVGAAGWQVTGVDGDRLSGDTLSLARAGKAADTGNAEAPTSQDFPAYVHLTRTLQLRTDWHVLNRVQRIAPAEAGFSVSLPLLPGEHPLGEDASVHDGRIEISFRAGQQQATWQSRIEPVTALSLSAPPLAERSETWEVVAASIWHVEGQGVPAAPADGMLAYRPLPGETLKLAVQRLEPAPGDSAAIDRVKLDTRMGDRASDLQLALTARSTRGGEHAVKLPTDASLIDASRDGRKLTLALDKGILSLPLLPGPHRYSISAREPGGIGLVTRVPDVDMQAETANIDISLTIPQARWVLWTWGPQNGPAVLYWPQLILLLLVAWGLARFAPTPLKLQHWILLGLGFSTFAWSAFALVAAWLILIGARGRVPAVRQWSHPAFNLMQIGLALLTVLALMVLIGAVPRGLLGVPDMHVTGNGSSASQLHWMLDRSDGPLPNAGVFSLPLWCYKAAILAWALWLANALIGWLRWAFTSWSAGGYWRGGDADEAPPESTEAPTRTDE